MEVNSEEIGSKIKLQDTVYIIGRMAESMRATGEKIICTDKDFTSGLMEGCMTATM